MSLPLRPWKGAGPAFLRPREDPETPSRPCQICIAVRKQLESRQGSPARNVEPDQDSPLNPIRIDIFELFDSAANESCFLCSLIWNGMSTLGAKLPSPETSAMVAVIAFPGSPMYVSWNLENVSQTAEIYYASGSSDALPSLGFANDICEEINSDLVFEMIADWISECNSDHRSCFQEGTSPPKRLLHMTGDLPDLDIRLEENLSEPVRYIALSHCWGRSTAFTTTTETLTQRKTSISWDELPQTFKDAIIVALRLEISYLWIDSLCILQDDPKDWEMEAAKMAEIYENAYLTLAAALAQDDSVGFLQTAPERADYLSREVQIMHDTKEVTGIRVRPTHDSRRRADPKPLATRAWTYQEWLISRRVLTFSECVQFECREDNFCECGSGVFPDPFYANLSQYRHPSRGSYTQILESEVDANKVFEYWLRRVVIPYADRLLTQDRDRLPAMSALAQKFQLKLGDQYLAGIWKADFVRALSWYQFSCISTPKESFRIAECPEEYVAPTWSWASIKAPVEFFPYVNHRAPSWNNTRSRLPNLRARLLGCDVSLKGVNVTGEVTHGHIRVLAPAAVARLVLSEGTGTRPCPLGGCGNCHGRATDLIRDGYYLNYDSGSAPHSNVLLDTAVEQIQAIRMDGGAITSLQRARKDLQAAKQAISGTVTLMLVYQDWADQDFRNLERVFLILGNTEVPGQYRRIGLFHIEQTSNSRCLSWFSNMPETELTIY